MSCMFLTLPLPPVSVVAGVLAATGRHFGLHQEALKWLKKLYRKNPYKMSSISLKSKCRKRNMLSYMRNELLARISSHHHRTHQHLNSDKQLESFITPTVPEDETEIFQEVIKLCEVHVEASFSSTLSFWQQITAKKISEGSYGEIYTFQHADNSQRVFKCMAVTGKHPSMENPNLSPEMVIPDIVCSTLLSKLNDEPLHLAPNFPRVYRISLVTDTFPTRMMSSWWEYKNSPERLMDPSEHPQPDLYEKNQSFLTIETSYCGGQLNANDLKNAWIGVSIVTQLVSAMAVAEDAFEFEHRDLHLGNILIRKTTADKLRYSMRDFHFSVHILKHQVFIIDYTLSRICKDQKVYYISLNEIDKTYEVPTEVTDNPWIHHETIYDMMTTYLQEDWSKFEPKTNSLWLRYIIENIVNDLEAQSLARQKLFGKDSEIKGMRLLRKWKDTVLDSISAKTFLIDVVLKDNPLISIPEECQ